MDHYLKELAPEQLVINGYDLWPVERYNVAPSTRVEIIRLVDEQLSIDKVKWGSHFGRKESALARLTRGLKQS